MEKRLSLRVSLRSFVYRASHLQLLHSIHLSLMLVHLQSHVLHQPIDFPCFLDSFLNNLNRLTVLTMDDSSRLKYRIVELETELRLVKEQLAQAQIGTQYLINCLSSQHINALAPRRGFDRPTTRDSSINQTTSHDIEHNFTQSRTPCSGLIHPPSIRRSSDCTANAQTLGQFEDAPLLTFDVLNESPFESAGSPASFDSMQTTLTNDSLIDSTIDTPTTPFTPSDGCNDAFASVAKRQPVGLGISDIDRGQPDDLEGWSACHSSFPVEPVLLFSRSFADHEHNRLMGSALFVEDMSSEEQKEHWKQLEISDGRHSAKDWKLYYDEVIRPAYLTKLGMSTVAEAVEQDVPSDNEIEAERTVSNGKVEDTLPKEDLASSMWAPEPQPAAGVSMLDIGESAGVEREHQASALSPAKIAAEDDTVMLPPFDESNGFRSFRFPSDKSPALQHRQCAIASKQARHWPIVYLCAG